MLCPCEDNYDATCLSTSALAMGYSLELSTEGATAAYIRIPPSLPSQWDIKLGPPVMSCSAPSKYLHNILIFIAMHILFVCNF